MGSSGNDLFKVGNEGNDTISGGGGHDKVQFDDSYHNATITIHNGDTTVQFSDTGQTIKMTGIEELHFTDHTTKV